jgi:peptide/nickel transport system permease protein
MRPLATRGLQRLLQDRLTLIGLLLLVPMGVLILIGPLLGPYGFDTIESMAMLQPPTDAHWLGTDDLGRDVLPRLMVGGQLSLSVGLGAVLLAVIVGLPLGLLSGYLGGVVDEVMMRLIDSLMALPPLVLALTITAVLGSGLLNAMLAIAVVAVPTFTRLVRGQVISVRG